MKQAYIPLLSMGRLICMGFLLIFAFSLLPNNVYAQTSSSASAINAQTDVKAKIGDLYLNISGYSNPYASIVLTVSEKFFRSALADSLGNFSFLRLPMKRGATGFCLKVVDYRHIGESKTCIVFPSAQTDVNKEKLFLPPTLGVSATKVNVGTSVSIYGYTMPNATVTVSTGKTIYIVTADQTGYYKAQPSLNQPGTYAVLADANLQGMPSLKSTEGKQIIVAGAKSFVSQLFMLVLLLLLLLLLLVPLAISLLFLYRRKKKKKKKLPAPKVKSSLR